MNTIKRFALPAIVAAAGVIGVGGGSLISNMAVSADTTSASTTAATSTDSRTEAASGTQQTPPDPSKGGHAANGVTETVLTGDEATKAKAAGEAAVPGATVERAETDAEGAKYEVHMKKSDGSQVTVKLDADYKVTSTEDGMR